MGPGPDGPMGAMGAMEPHHMNGSLGRVLKQCGLKTLNWSEYSYISALFWMLLTLKNKINRFCLQGPGIWMGCQR